MWKQGSHQIPAKMGIGQRSAGQEFLSIINIIKGTSGVCHGWFQAGFSPVDAAGLRRRMERFQLEHIESGKHHYCWIQLFLETLPPITPSQPNMTALPYNTISHRTGLSRLLLVTRRSPDHISYQTWICSTKGFWGEWITLVKKGKPVYLSF